MDKFPRLRPSHLMSVVLLRTKVTTTKSAQDHRKTFGIELGDWKKIAESLNSSR
jgi:hypothetical protein